MKARTLSLMAGGAAALIATTGARSEFLGIYLKAQQDVPVFSVRVYAVFDRPGQDAMLAVAGTANAPLFIEVYSGGTFFQSPIGNDQAPLDGLIDAFPSLAYDSYVTIGVKSVGPPNGQPADDTLLFPLWPGFGASSLQMDNSGWGAPGAPQSDPFDPVNRFPGDGRVMIGQFSTTSGGLMGTMLLQVRSNGVVQQATVNFFDDFPNCIDASHCAIDPCEGSGHCQDSQCLYDQPIPDCNNNGTNDTCETPNPCPVNVLDGCSVEVTDFLALLAAWGPCAEFCPADVNGDGVVGINDMLDLLANWGPCP